MAFYELEPFGDEVADLRHGTAAALAANMNRNAETKPAPFVPQDFIHWGEGARRHEPDAPVLLADPVAQSNLIRAAMFGIQPQPAP